MHVKHDVPLAGLTTLGLGGPAHTLVTLEREDDAREAHALARRSGMPLVALGGGSNVVVADGALPAVVAQVDVAGVEAHVEGGRVVVDVGAGEAWESLVDRAVDEGWSGIEALAGIPGRVGATPIQNVGAYGQEVRETIVHVRAFDRVAEQFVTLDNAACAFGYRHSRFKDDPSRFIVTSVRFSFARTRASSPLRYAELARALGVAEGATVDVRIVRDRVVALRRQKGMVWRAGDPTSLSSAGSFFLNPVVDADDAERVQARARASNRLGPAESMPAFPAGAGHVKLAAAWLVERAGFAKGTRRGAVGVSPFHALALVRYDGGTTRDLVAFASEIRRGVLDAFGVSLVAEPVFLGVTMPDP